MVSDIRGPETNSHTRHGFDAARCKTTTNAGPMYQLTYPQILGISFRFN